MQRSRPSFRTRLTLIMLCANIAACGEPSLSTAEISDRAKAVVRENLGLSARATLFSDVFIPGYEDGDLMACGTVSGTRANGETISPRRFIVRVEPSEWVAFEAGAGSDANDFDLLWSDICRRPSDRSEVPFFPA